MAFHAGVATWFAVHILVRMPVGGRFGINNQAIPVAIRLETGDGLDDIEVSLSDGGTLHIQCKTSANLSTGKNAPLAKTVSQLACWVADKKAGSGLPDLTRTAAVLAVRADAPRTLDGLEAGCRAFDHGGNWAVTRSERNHTERTALGMFEEIARPAWKSHRGDEAEDADLVDLARIFRIARFTMDEGDSDWREAARLLGHHLFGDDTAGEGPIRDLKSIMRTLIGSGAPADRRGLLRALRQRGHDDLGTPRFEADIANLQALTDSELGRLADHGRLPLAGGVSITRESDHPLVNAIRAGSLVVTGDPGAGKTGALVHAARAIEEAGGTVVFLSVDRFPGVSIANDLDSELGLTNSIVETLEAMPRAGQKILILDALDAARGGPSEAVFASLIERVNERLEDDWIIVASIRSFDLKNGRRFREAFAGGPADVDYADADLSAVRHFLVPRLSEDDLVTATYVSPELGALLESASPHFVDLLKNIFNLSLAADLLANGIEPGAFKAIRTQSGLIDAYENVRLDTTQLQQAAATTAAVMGSRRRLSVRKVLIDNPALDEVIQRGVLVQSGDWVSFAHNLLFDHIAGRFYLEWDDPDALLSQISGSTSTALLLAPALRFAVERLWCFDGAGRQLSWRLIFGIFSAERVDPVLSNVALRIVVENIQDEEDIIDLTARISSSPDDPVLQEVVARLVRFVAMEIEATRTVGPVRALVWTRLAETLTATRRRLLLDAARVLLHALFEHDDLTSVSVLNAFGRAARALLESAWASSPLLVPLSETAIRFVAKSFASDPSASRCLLTRILQEPHFSRYADREATWLAEQILPITRADPEFTVEIYRTLYGRTISDDATSWLGGRPSRILPLTSNRRQDYEHCRWQLGTAMGEVLLIAPEKGTRALIDALIGQVATRGYGDARGPRHVFVGGSTIELRGGEIEFNAWDEDQEDRPSRDDDLLSQYVQFLRTCDAASFSSSVEAASREYATASVWARIFGVGSERIDDVGDFLWPLIERPDFLEESSTLRDAVRFVAAAWPSRTREARMTFERMSLAHARDTDEDGTRRWNQILGRIFSLLPESAIESDEMLERRRALDAEGLLQENVPITLCTTMWEEQDDFVREEARRAGVDVESTPNREILEASDSLHDRVNRTPPESAAQDLAALWDATEALIALIDASSGVHEQIHRSVWGHIANAVERIASSPNFEPGREGLPDLQTVFTVLERLSLSPYPEPETREQ